MAVNTYEILYLLDPNKFSADPEAALGAVNGIIEHHGGQIVYSRPWGEPKLAYPIKNFKKGAYVLSYFNIDGLAIPKIEHDLKLQDLVLRHLIIRLHEKIAEKVVEHVTTVGAHHEPPRETEGKRGRW